MHNIVFGYIYNKNGLHEGRTALPATPKNIVNFICSDFNDKVITDEFDNLLCSTMGLFLDQCKPEFREYIIDDLIKIQQTGERTSYETID